MTSFVESSVAETWCKVCVWTAVRWESRQLLAIKERISQMMWMVASAVCSWSPFPSFFHSRLITRKSWQDRVKSLNVFSFKWRE